MLSHPDRAHPALADLAQHTIAANVWPSSNGLRMGDSIPSVKTQGVQIFSTRLPGR